MSIGDLFREAVSLTAVEDAIVQYSHASVSLQAFPVPNPSSEDIIAGLLSPSSLPLAVLTSCQLSFPSAKNITLNPGCSACSSLRPGENREEHSSLPAHGFVCPPTHLSKRQKFYSMWREVRVFTVLGLELHVHTFSF